MDVNLESHQAIASCYPRFHVEHCYAKPIGSKKYFGHFVLRNREGAEPSRSCRSQRRRTGDFVLNWNTFSHYEIVDRHAGLQRTPDIDGGYRTRAYGSARDGADMRR